MPAQNLAGAVTTESLGSFIPCNQPPLMLEHQDGVVLHTLHEQTEPLFGGRRSAIPDWLDRDNRARPYWRKAACCWDQALTRRHAAERNPGFVEAHFRFDGSSLPPALPR